VLVIPKVLEGKVKVYIKTKRMTRTCEDPSLMFMSQ
jgi:hypothetical protein